MTVLLGIDLGTTALKCAIFDEKGSLLAVSTQEYSLYTPEINYVEMEVETYWEALKKGLSELKSNYDFTNDQIAVSFSAQGETLICVDHAGKVLRNAIVWMDNRAEEEAKTLQELFGNEMCYRITGQVSFEPCWPASKILWLQHNEPDIFHKTAKFLLIEDYFIYRMTGHYVTEGSLLCSSTYWNIVTKEYWQEMLQVLGITDEKLPLVMESGVIVDDMLPEIKSELGLKGKVTVSTGALDQAAGAIGVGNVKEGMFSEAVGAALAICVPVNQPVFDPNRKMPLHYFAIPDMYMIHTFTTGGMTLRWFRDKFCTEELSIEKISNEDAYELISKEAAWVPAGSDGLVMLPHLTGSLAPDVNAKAKGVWFGITLKHTKAHFARAIMESLGYILRRNIETLNDMDIHVSEVRSLGGGSKSDVWNQIKSDINQLKIITMQTKEAACLGAAVLAGKSIGLFPNVEEAAKSLSAMKKEYCPSQANKEIYDKGYEMYCRIFGDLSQCFENS